MLIECAEPAACQAITADLELLTIQLVTASVAVLAVFSLVYFIMTEWVVNS